MSAKTCPYCEEDKKARDTRSNKALLGIFVLGFGFWLIMHFMPDAPPDPNKIEREMKSGANYICQKFVKKELKAPSTAQFAERGEWQAIRLDDGNYQVTSWVEAQNSFGAMLRTPYVCVVTPIGNDQWTLVRLKMK